MGKRRLLIGALGSLALIVFVFAVPSLRWRAQLLILQVRGEIPGLTLQDVANLVAPGSDQHGSRLVSTRNPYSVIRNRHGSAADIQAGATLFRDRCATCHAVDASGTPAAPALVGREFKHGDSDWAVFTTIRSGVPNTAMQAHALPDTQIWQLVSYLRSIDTGSSRHDETRVAVTTPLPYAELEALTAPGEDWLTYSGSYQSTRHSTLTQITPANVSQLALRWAYQFDVPPTKIETSPIVRKGIMYVTAPPGVVVALDARTGEQLWSFNRAPNSDTVGEAGGIINRGVALLDDKVFVGTWDSHLIALSAKTGEVLWDSVVIEDKRYIISAAPLVYRDLVVTGVGTTKGGRGFIAAYDVNTGKERWRYVTIPGPGEFGNDTWAGDSWKEGGAPTWMTGSYDVEADLLIWGIGNPKPDYDASARAGDNLFSNSVLALRGTTGEYVWHFQFTPNDSRDWDSNQIPILVDYPGRDGIPPRKCVLFANRNGFYYVLDRENGKFLGGRPFVHQTWTDGLDANGRPLPRSAAAERLEGSLLYPGNIGGTNWWSPAYNPQLNLFYVPALEQGMVFFNSGDDWPVASNKPFYTAIRALDAETGALVWEHRSAPRLKQNEMGGLLSTATGIVFGSDLSTLYALDARSGSVLWSVPTGARIGAAPVTYAVDGEQHVAITGGRTLMAFALPRKADDGAIVAAAPHGASQQPQQRQ